MQYRKDIDGLRGFTVILIILYNLNFHQNPNSFYEGFFLSVDVFFVISGYLITNIILDKLDKKKFSFSEFYKRRIRRMLPSLLVVLIISTLFSYFLLVPTDIIDHAKSVLSSIFFSSNFYFHFTGQQLYQSEATHLKPLLHTWTLSIEEQFYLLYPAILFFLFKFLKKKIFSIIFILTIISLIGNFFFINEPSLTFYITPFRAWEIGSGCIVAMINKKKIFSYFTKFKEIRKILYEIIFIFFLLSFLLYDEKNHYLFQVACVFSASLLIAINHNNQTISKYLFSSTLLVKIGIISYSVYLFQHFVLAYIKIGSFFLIDGLVSKILIVLVIFIMSILNYFLIEKPCRYKLNLKSKYFIFSFLIIILVNLFFIYNKGFLKSFSVNEVMIDNKYLHSSWLKTHKPNDFDKFLRNTKKKILIAGNSYGWDVFNALKSSKGYSKNYQFAYKNIDFIENIYFSLINKDQKLIKLIQETDVLLFSTAWRHQNDFEYLDKAVAEINKINHKATIIIQSQAPEFFHEKQKYKMKNIYFTRIDQFLIENKKLPNEVQMKNLKKIYYKDYIASDNIKKINSKLKIIAKENNIKFIKSEDFFCDKINKECDFLTNDNKKIYWDNAHLTEAGWKFFGKKFFELNYLDSK